MISGAESWEDIELYARSKQEWLLSIAPLPHGLLYERFPVCEGIIVVKTKG